MVQKMLASIREKKSQTDFFLVLEMKMCIFLTLCLIMRNFKEILYLHFKYNLALCTVSFWLFFSFWAARMHCITSWGKLTKFTDLYLIHSYLIGLESKAFNLWFRNKVILRSIGPILLLSHLIELSCHVLKIKIF